MDVLLGGVLAVLLLVVGGATLIRAAAQEWEKTHVKRAAGPTWPPCPSCGRKGSWVPDVSRYSTGVVSFDGGGVYRQNMVCGVMGGPKGCDLRVTMKSTDARHWTIAG